MTIGGIKALMARRYNFPPCITGKMTLAEVHILLGKDGDEKGNIRFETEADMMKWLQKQK